VINIESNLKDLLNLHQRVNDLIGEKLGFNLRYPIELNINEWIYNDCDVSWFIDNEEYSEEAIIVHEQDDMVVFLVYLCTGDKVYVVFDNAKRIHKMTEAKIKTITIPLTEYEDLQKAALWEQALESAGVDNWDGYDEAVMIYQEMLND
jgi:hypothetical protein